MQEVREVGETAPNDLSPFRLCVRLVLLFLLLSLCSCAARTKISQFRSFAEAGKVYTRALAGSAESEGSSTPGLLDYAGEVLVNSNSDKLLQTQAEFPGTVTQEEFDRQDGAMRQNLVELGLLKRQVRLLSDYFQALADLATSKAPEAFGAEAKNTVSSINGLTQALNGSSLFGRPEAAAMLSQSLGELIVRGIQVKLLKTELEERKETIARVLRLHQALLEALKAQIKSDLELGRNRLYEKEVMKPFLEATFPNGVQESEWKGWKAKRLELLQEPPVIAQVQQASKALQAMQRSWIKLLSNDVTSEDIQGIVRDLQPILASLGGLTKEKTPGGGG